MFIQWRRNRGFRRFNEPVPLAPKCTTVVHKTIYAITLVQKAPKLLADRPDHTKTALPQAPIRSVGEKGLLLNQNPHSSYQPLGPRNWGPLTWGALLLSQRPSQLCNAAAFFPQNKQYIINHRARSLRFCFVFFSGLSIMYLQMFVKFCDIFDLKQNFVVL